MSQQNGVCKSPRQNAQRREGRAGMAGFRNLGTNPLLRLIYFLKRLLKL